MVVDSDSETGLGCSCPEWTVVNWSHYSNSGLSSILPVGYMQVNLMLISTSVLEVMSVDCLMSGCYSCRLLRSYYPCVNVQYQFYELQHFSKLVDWFDRGQRVANRQISSYSMHFSGVNRWTSMFGPSPTCLEAKCWLICCLYWQLWSAPRC